MYIAEFHNTWSNFLFVLVGLHGWRYSTWQGFEARFQGVYVGVVVIGLGSAAFHATLLKVAQQCDETPMIWSVLCWYVSTYASIARCFLFCETSYRVPIRLYLLYEPDWTDADRYYASHLFQSKEPAVGSRDHHIFDHGSTSAAKVERSSLFRFLCLIYNPVDRAEQAFRRLHCSRACCNRRNRTLAIWVYGAVFAVLHAIYEPTVLFFLQFALLLSCRLRTIFEMQQYCMRKIIIHRAGCVNEMANLLAARYPKTVVVALMCWLCDMHMCNTMRALPVNPQGHAIWHILMALSVYWGMQFMHFVRAAQLGWRPRVETGICWLPQVVVTKPREQKITRAVQTRMVVKGSRSPSPHPASGSQ